MSAQDREPAGRCLREDVAGPERMLAILFQARRMRRRVLQDLAVRLFWMPGKLVAGLDSSRRHVSKGSRVDCS